MMNVPREAPARARTPGQQLSRTAFYVHLWLGVLFTAVLLVLSVTGILLNHKVPLGLMPDVSHEPTAEFADALPLTDLARRALEAAGESGGVASIDRMDVRPRRGLVKVRLRDPESTEVTLDIATGSVLHIGARGDVFLERLHSGEALGEGWVLLSDAGAIALIVLLVSGYWLWLWPRWRR